MSREITKTRTTTYKITNVAVDFLTFNESYKRIRGNFTYQGFSCFSCNKRFELGEKISVVFTNKGNKVICHDCAVGIEQELKAGA